MKITLNENELQIAAYEGVRRQIVSISKNPDDEPTRIKSKGWIVNIEEACAEFAFGKATNRCWNGSRSSFKLSDGGYVQIKIQPEEIDDLIIRKNEVGTFVLVTGGSSKYKIHGWFNSLHTRDEHLKKYSETEKAFFIPQRDLYPLSTLK